VGRVGPGRRERLLSLFHQGFFDNWTECLGITSSSDSSMPSPVDVLVGVPIQCLVKEGTDVVLD